ncbi:hypothetical protein ACCO45_006826 [Purpureocillium lilacinum]|uniref:Uncharacterized protein n=1 Tax=Purpureocillium lilacinum TaxID=33203 RepID=A0ACC4DSY6_PURLI
MPSFFQFTQGSETRFRPADASSPLLGRFRALGLLADRVGDGRGSVHVGYGALLAAELEAEAAAADDDDDDDGNGGNGDPRQTAVRRVVERWWSRYGLLVFLPALLAVAWCSVPFPQYPLPDYNDDPDGTEDGHKAPGHGEAEVQVNFWFFLFVYYGFYNITALIWITKVFNLYSLNWWPQSLGFPLTVSLIAVLSIAAPIPVFFIPETRFLTVHNTAWISWTFIIMAMPVAIAFIILTTNERHIGLRHSLSETQRIFTTSWWTGEPDTLPRGSAPFSRGGRGGGGYHFVRFLWFCVALFVGLMAYVIGEAYAEIYLRTLPHNNLETVVYVYGWVITLPLSWVFKLYFMLTYQTYVRALYARLRTPSQFITLQVLSSTGLVVVTPIMMTRLFHRALTVLGLNTQSYGSYQKLQTRNVFIRFLAENASMATFVGSILVLHFGANKRVYPYFSFDQDDGPYNFALTLKFSLVTWGCELVASLAVRGLIRVFFGVDVGLEGRLDLAVWPELLPTCVTVMLHVLQNMLFSIIRLQFHPPGASPL